MTKKRKLVSSDPRQASLASFMTPTKKKKTSDEVIAESAATPTKPTSDTPCPPTPKTPSDSRPTAGPPRPITPKTPADSRKFRHEWKTKFSFLRYDANLHLMFCTACERAGRDNIWTSGCDKFKSDAVKKHAGTGDHKFAVQAQDATVSIEQAAIKAAEKERDGVEGLMNNLYFLAQRNDPSSAVSDLNTLLIHHKVSRFDCLVKTDNTLPYEHHDSVREMQEAMATVVHQQLLEDVQQSGIYSIMCDESTDVSTEKTLVLYIRYVSSAGKSETKFLEVTELNGDECNAVNLTETILRIMDMRGLSVENLACLTTDGASVMSGVRGGVTTLMKQRNGHLLSVHCIAHRLALASGQSADSIKYLKKYQAMVNTIYKYYHYLPKHQSKLKKIQAIFEMSEIKFKQTFHTRWLSFDGAVDAIIQNYDALQACLEMDVAEESDPVANGLLRFTSTYQFLYTSHLLKDVLGVLAILSKNFQTRDLTVADQSSQLRSAVKSLEEMKSVPGPFLKTFMESLPDEFEQGFEFGGDGHSNRIKCTPDQVKQSRVIRTKFLNKLLDNLHERFQDNGTVSCFSVFDPAKLPATEDGLLLYGQEQIHGLAEFYGNGDGPMSVQPDHLKAEWAMFKFHLFNGYKGVKFSVMATSVLQDKAVVCSYPNVCKLLRVCLVLPVSSADCERGFSRYNLIKTKPRNRLCPSTVNTLMMLTVDTPDLKNMKQFNFHRAFDIWATTKARRTNQIVK